MDRSIWSALVATGIFISCGLFAGNAHGQVKTYPAPTGTGAIPLYNAFTVTVGGLASPVYQAKVGIQYTYQWPGPDPLSEPVGFTSFDTNGPVTAVIQVSGRTVQSAKILPSVKGVIPTVSGNTVTVQLPGPGKYELQINGSDHNPLYLFANPLEVNPPTKSGTGVIYYGPGIHNVGLLEIPSNTTVYIAGGAVVHGQLTGTGESNIVVRGRGILDGSTFATHDGNMVHFDSITGLQIEGIVITDSPGWTVPIWYSKNVVIDNIKIFGFRQNSDGIDLVSNNGVEVKNCFIRNWDDGITVKAWNNVNANNYYIHDCVLATDYGNSTMEIGAEEQAADVSQIKFENIDVIHSHANVVMDIGTGDQANIHDISYNNIRIENFYGNPGYVQAWIAIWQEVGQWSGNGGFGHIYNISYNNINIISGAKFESGIYGGDANHMIDNVTFSNIVYMGTPLTNASALNLTVSNATNVRFVTPVPAAPANLKATAANGEISLSWSAVSGATTYSVFRGTSMNGESATAIASGLTSPSYVNRGLSNGQIYYYKVKAVNASGSSAYSNEASATPIAPPAVPAAPANLKATAANGEVSLSWSAVSGATTYSVFRGTSMNGESATAIASGLTSPSYVNRGLSNGQVYYYKVKAVNASGSSAYSNEASATPVAPIGGNLITIDDNASGWTYSGWTAYSDPNCQSGTAHGGQSAGSFAQYTFTGKAVDIYAWKGPDGGSVQIYIDGVAQGGTVSLLNPPTAVPSGDIYKRNIFSKTWPASGTHTVRIQSTTGNWTMIDYLTYQN